MYCDICGAPANIRIIIDDEVNPIEDLKLCWELLKPNCATTYAKERLAQGCYIGAFNFHDEVSWNGIDIGRYCEI